MVISHIQVSYRIAFLVLSPQFAAVSCNDSLIWAAPLCLPLLEALNLELYPGA